ncbi:MAG: TetR/AcrR family transcriptional regulator [Rhodococcus sp. (in: high G+C Gram-positive bacteria)]
MTTTGAGRPRLTTRKRPGATAREEILDAAAELFTTRGFASTSTRMIADAVGVRQASLYHHFATKDDILAALLVGTVDSPIDCARALRADSNDAPSTLYALVLFDSRQLSASRWNLGALYLTPELRTERFEYFRARRSELMELYRQCSRDALVAIGTIEPAPDTVLLPFRIVETVINARSDAESDGGGTAAIPTSIADAAVRVLGWQDSTESLQTRAEHLLATAV